MKLCQHLEQSRPSNGNTWFLGYECSFWFSHCYKLHGPCICNNNKKESIFQITCIKSSIGGPVYCLHEIVRKNLFTVNTHYMVKHTHWIIGGKKEVKDLDVQLLTKKGVNLEPLISMLSWKKWVYLWKMSM